MRTPRPRASSVGPGPRRIAAVIALLAVLLPVAGLVWAGMRARDAVIEQVLTSQAATARSVAAQVQRGQQQSLDLSRAAAGRPSLQDGLTGHDPALIERAVANSAQSGPFAGVALYDLTGVLLGASGAVGVLADPLAPEQVGPPVVFGDDCRMSIREPVLLAGTRIGTLVLTVSWRKAMPDLDELRFSRTSVTSVVAADGSFLLTPEAALRGSRITRPAGLALAAHHVAGRSRGYSPRFHTRIVTNYAPVSGSSLGVFTRQFESEAFATADRLQHRLRLAALGALTIGLTLLGAGARVQRRYRQRLSARDAELRDVITRSNDVIARYDADRKCVFISPAVEAVLGYTPDERIGRSMVDLLHPAELERFMKDRPQHDEGDEDTRTLRVVHRDGHDVWVEVATTIDRGRDGAIRGYNTVSRDITARHRYEVELSEARDAALAASHSKSIFLANTSHELRTPLNGILGLTEVLLGTRLDPRQREYAQTVQDSGRSLLRILDDILDLAKIEAGKVEVESVPFALVDTVERAVAPFRPLAQAKAVALQVECGSALPGWVLGDPTRFAQVLVNLVSNALKFTATGQVLVLVEAEDDHIAVQVTDTGIGIAPHAFEQLFTAFTQADSSTTRSYGGTGLGLAVSRQLAELQGGTLTGASTLGRGSTFTLAIPLTSTAAPTAPVQTWSAAAGRSLLVLVAEDNIVNQLVARTMLEQLGHRVDVVADGRAAVAAVLEGTHPYDAVLMDCQMPVLDGYAATGAIRNGQPNGVRTPILGLTASAMTQEREQGLAAGMDLYLTKPIRLQELDDALTLVSDAAPVPALALALPGETVRDPARSSRG